MTFLKPVEFQLNVVIIISLLFDEYFLHFICYLSGITIFSYWLFSYSYINRQFQVEGSALAGIRSRSTAWQAPTLIAMYHQRLSSLSLLLSYSLSLSLTVSFPLQLSLLNSVFLSWTLSFHFSASFFSSFLLSLPICPPQIAHIFLDNDVFTFSKQCQHTMFVISCFL